MTPEFTATVEILTLILLALQLLATVAIAWVVHQSAARVARVNILRSLRETWVSIDSFALGDERTLAIADALLPEHPTHQTVDFSRKRLFLLAYLNPIATWFHAAEEGIYGAKTEENLEVVRGLLKSVLVDEDAYWVTQHHWYGESFARLCDDIHASLPVKLPKC
jgi:hypothetical protein